MRSISVFAVLAFCWTGVVSAAAMVPRPPGSLLLNMLIKNEAEHLTRTLPKWAKIIDGWIIGVDDHNTDNSEEVIKRYLGHIPGKIVIVKFDGMGPTWSVLVKAGLEAYPNITHGILADADFMPMSDKLNKMELDIRCKDHRNERKMDWIYRNVEGAVVKRRTHQILEVPAFPNQEVFQTLISLNVEEREGGYGDRSGMKNQRYIEMLEKDLAEYPGDTRTLYYLGYAHFDIYNQNKDHANQSHWDHLEKGVNYFKIRAHTPGGNSEELWFALLKLGEIYERFYKNWDQSEKYYKNCSQSDPERADAWFYLGQHYRLHNDIPKALPYLKTAATLPIPQRSLFQWHYLYNCLSKLEYGRAVLAAENPKRSLLKGARRILAIADCVGGDPGNLGEVRSIKEMIEVKLEASKKKQRRDKQKKADGDSSSSDSDSGSSASASDSAAKPKAAAANDHTASEKADALSRLLNFISKKLHYLDDNLATSMSGVTNAEMDADPDLAGRPSYVTALLRKITAIQTLYDQYKADKPNAESIVTCRRYRQVTSPYLKFFKRFAPQMTTLMNNDSLMTKWSSINTVLRATCR